MALYLHYEGQKGSPFTMKLSASSRDKPLDSVILDFLHAYGQRIASSSSSTTTEKNILRLECLEMCLHDGEILRKMGDKLSACALEACETTDIFLVDCSPRTIITPPREPSIITAPINHATASLPPPPLEPAINASGVTTSSIASVLKHARELFQVRSYKKARELVQETMKEVQVKGLEQLGQNGRKFTQDCSLHEFLAELFLKTERYPLAVDHAEKALECRVSIGPKNSSGSTQRYLYFLLATVHFQAENFEDAWAALVKAIEQCNMTKQSTTATTIGRAYQWFHLDVLALKAHILFGLNKHQQAAEVVNSCMSDPQCEKHLPVLLAYATFAAQYGKHEEAIRSLLKAVVLDQQDKRSRRLLARLLDTSAGLHELQQQLPPSESSASAYAFLATICKDHAAIGAARRMLEIALKYKPMNASYALNLVHVIELQGDGKFYEEAIKVAENYLLVNREFLRVGKRGFTAKQLWQALQGATVEEEGIEGVVVAWVDSRETESAGVSTGAATQGGQVITMPLRRSSNTTELSFVLDGVEITAADMHPTHADKEEYDGDALDLLALAFTMVKLLYLQGKLHRLGALFKVIEPSRLRSRTPIHETTIRNEHAYYQCVAQTLSYRLYCATTATGNANALLPRSSMPAMLREQMSTMDKERSDERALKLPISDTLLDPRAVCCDVYSWPAFRQAATKPIYVMGDSHTVPAAWNVINVAAENAQLEPRLLVPKLVTGIKQYHLRKDSDFYPKAQYAALLRSVPDGADVIFVIGEIDCREGILVGVQKDSYESVRQGMESTITHFAQTLPNLIKQRKMRISIHPVLPMLTETRHLVVTFNEHYRRIMKTLNVAPGVRWLDFFDQLIVADSELMLRPGLRMDGTHITPGYVSLIENALNMK